jgi:Protein of unknown function (DUF2905)
MSSLGRTLIGLGLLLVVIGGLIVLLDRFGLPLGRLPGDITYRGKRVSFFLPLSTSILISLLLTLIVAVSRLRR